jgi:hypothetical protein
MIAHSLSRAKGSMFLAFPEFLRRIRQPAEQLWNAKQGCQSGLRRPWSLGRNPTQVWFGANARGAQNGAFMLKTRTDRLCMGKI